MANWTNLPTNYRDEVWEGDRKFVMTQNQDDTVSFEDVTEYLYYQESFFGANDANQMNAAINNLMTNMDQILMSDETIEKWQNILDIE